MLWQLFVGLLGLVATLMVGGAIWFGFSWLVLLAMRALPLRGSRKRR